MDFRLAVPLASIVAIVTAGAQTINPARRAVTANNFSVTWNTGVDTEAIAVLDWMGANVTGTDGVNTCSGDGATDYWGNAWVPPDPYLGALGLVGAGTVTPAGKLPWVGQILNSGILQVTINSSSVNCPPTSAGVNVQTTYRFFNPKSSFVNWFQVQRVFDFTNAPFPHDIRPNIPRLDLTNAYTEVLYPTTTGTLQIADVYNCDYGCTGPKAEPDALPLTPAWDPLAGWFAVHDPTTLEGVVVKRENSLDPPGSPLTPQLWIDYDLGPPAGSAASSFLLIAPPNGFTGLLTDVETFCFYDKSIWTPSLTPPVGCRAAQLEIRPSILTFPPETVGATSHGQTAILKNYGPSTVRVIYLVASEEFPQSNDCPTELLAGMSCAVTVFFKPSSPGIQSGTVSVFDDLEGSPQRLTLAGLGVAAQ